MFWRLVGDSFFVVQARSGVGRIQVHERGDTRPASVHPFRASRLEGAAFRRQGQGIAGNCGKIGLVAVCNFFEILGDGLKQRFCIGMTRRSEHGLGWAALDYAAAIENQDAIGETGEQSGIVRDEDHRQAEFFLERSKEAENFHLRGGVKRRRGFVRDDDRGAAGNGLGDEDALALAAAELMRIRVRDAAGVCRKEQREYFASALTQNAVARLRVRGQHLTNLFAGAHGGMEREKRLLENHGDARAADATQFLGVGLQKVLAFKKDGAMGDPSIRWKEFYER